MRYTLLSGAGNLFAVVDGFADRAPEDPAALARALCAPREQGGLVPRPDGLLLVLPPRAGGDCRMELYNADGSAPETCGNGLRCVAKLVRERGHVARDAFTVEDDAGPHPTVVELSGGRVVRARISMGRPRILARERIAALGGAHDATLVDVGNPHCVLVVEDERTAPVTTLGPALERHARFPAGTNVEFLAPRDGGFHLRVWERGVGETQACGSGACAAAVAAVDRGLARFPVALALPGGVLVVEAEPDDRVVLGGPVEQVGDGEWRPARAGGAGRRA